jgi:hypothetical protein
VIHALGGADVVRGRGGSDTICGQLALLAAERSTRQEAPRDGDLDEIAECDVGAYELQPPPACGGRAITIKGTDAPDVIEAGDR